MSNSTNIQKMKLYGIKSRSKQTLQNKTKLTKEEVEDYINEGTEAMRYLYNNDTNQVIEVDIKNKNPKNVIKNGVSLLKKWGIKQLPIGKVIKAETTLKKKLDITKQLNVNSAIVSIHMYFIVSNDNKYKFIRFATSNVDVQELQGEIYNSMFEYLYGYGTLDESEIDRIIVRVFDEVGKNRIFIEFPDKKKILRITDYILRKSDHYDICNMWGNVIKMPDITGDENCVTASLKLLYPKISPKSIDKYFTGGKKGDTIGSIVNFCKDYKIKLIMYNFDGDIIASNYPTKKNDKKTCIFMAYNNHIYSFENKVLEKITIPKENVKVYETLDEEFNKLLNEKKIPNNIRLFTKSDLSYDEDAKKSIQILSFEHNDYLHTANKDYDICKSILNKFGLADKIYPNIKLTNILDILLSLYTSSKVKSFFPHKLNKSIVNYVNNDLYKKINNKTKLLSIDKSKAYTNALYDLSYLIHVDFRQAKIIKHTTNPSKINPQNVYLARPNTPCYLLPNIEYYAGYFLEECSKYGFEFTILEEIETHTETNYYKYLITDLFKKVDQVTAKQIMVSHIGKMEKHTEVETSMTCKLGTYDELCLEYNQNDIYRYNKELYITIENKSYVSNIYNNKFIKMQILDKARLTMFEKMREIKLNESELLAIETDCITFVDNGNYEELKKTLGKDLLFGWKQEHKTLCDFNTDKDYDTVYEKDNSILPKRKGDGELWDCYAGCGKSYYIKNKLISELEKVRENDYFIVTPSHNASKDYYRNDYNCKVIQTFDYTPELPTQKNIIVDEFGLCNKQGHDFLYRCMIAGKKIYAFGDFKQLLPVNEKSHLNQQHYLDMMFGKIHTMDTNYRNHFTRSYYDKLINEELDLKEEIKKYRTKDYKDAEIIICKTNAECDKYNRMIADDLTVKYKTNKKGELLSFEETEGLKIICQTNKLRVKNIYNNFDFIIKEIDEDNIIFDDDTVIEKKQLKHFTLGYAITSYKAQGQEFKSFYIPDSSLENIGGRFAYTIISRLKTKQFN